MKTVGEHSFSVDFTNGSAQTHFTVTFSGTDKMFIDDIFVKQILRAGESYTSALASFEVEVSITPRTPLPTLRVLKAMNIFIL